MFAVREGPNRARTEVRRQHTIKSIGPPTPLQVAQHDATRLTPGDLLQSALQVLADPAEARCVQFVALVLIDQLVTDLESSFGDDDNTKIRPRKIARTYLLCDCF